MKLIQAWDPFCGVLWRFGIATRRDRHPLVLVPWSHLGVTTSPSGDVVLFDLREQTLVPVGSGRHAEVTRFCATPDGRRVISGSQDGTIKVWRIEGMTEDCTLTGHTGAIVDMDITPDGRWLISGSADFDLWVWDLDGGLAPAPLLGHTSLVFAVAALPDGQRVVSGSDDGTMRVWEIEKHRELRVLDAGSPVNALAVTPDGTVLASGHADGRVQLWDTSSWEVVSVLEGHESSVDGLVVSADGTRLVSLSLDGSARLWDLQEKGMIDVWSQRQGSIGPGASFQLPPQSGETSLSDLNAAVQAFRAKASSAAFASAAMTPDGELVMVASDSGVLEVHLASTGALVGRLDTEVRGLSTIAVMPDGHTVVASTEDGDCISWALENIVAGPPVVKGWQAPGAPGMGIRCPFCRQWTVTDVSVKDQVFLCSACGSAMRNGKGSASGDWQTIAKTWDAVSAKVPVSARAACTRPARKDMLPVVERHGAVMHPWSEAPPVDVGWRGQDWGSLASAKIQGDGTMPSMAAINQEMEALQQQLDSSLSVLDAIDQQTAELRAARGLRPSLPDIAAITNDACIDSRDQDPAPRRGRRKQWWQFWR
jgi:WD40 repeat protein